MKIFMCANYGENSHFLDLMIYTRLARTVPAGCTSLEDVGRSLNGAQLTLQNRAKLMGETKRNPNLSILVDYNALCLLASIPGVGRDGLILGFPVHDIRDLPEMTSSHNFQMIAATLSEALAKNPATS